MSGTKLLSYIHSKKIIMKILSFILSLLLLGCQAQSQKAKENQSILNDGREVAADFPGVVEQVVKADKEWAKILSKEEYYVLREAGTERPFTGDLWDNKKEGVYVCRGCNLALFSSKTKYKSGTGWPSFYEPIDKKYVGEDTDYKIGYPRTEVHCARCGGHLGHVFPDGPKPTGLRYCINGVSLDFVPDLPDSTEKIKE